MRKQMLCENIRQIRLKKNLTHAKIAQNLSISRRVYTLYENGKNYLQIEYAISLAKLYNVSLDYLLGNQITKLTIENFSDVYEFTINIMEENPNNICNPSKDYEYANKISIPKSMGIG